MGITRKARWIAGVMVASLLIAGGSWAGCETLDPTHCMPPPCPSCEASTSTLSVSSPAIHPVVPIAHGRRARGRDLRLWFLLSFRALLAAARAF